MRDDGPEQMAERYCTFTEAARMIGVERHTIARWAKQGLLTVHRLAGLALVEREAVTRLQERRSS